MALQNDNLKFANMVITSALISKYPDRNQDQIAHGVLNVTAETFSRWRNGRKKIGKSSIRTISGVLGSTAPEIAKAYNDLLEGTLDQATAPKCLEASFLSTRGQFKKPANKRSQSDLSGTTEPRRESQTLSGHIPREIHVNLDTLGRNEALGLLANELVQVSGAGSEKLARIYSINAKFKKSKAMLENFLGIESPTLSGVLYDYSKGTKRSKNDIERLVAAGVDIESIRDYGTSAFREAANIFSKSSFPTRVVLLVSGDPMRRKLFLEILSEISEESEILGWVDIRENDTETHEANFQKNGTQTFSKIVAVLMPMFEAAKCDDPKLRLANFLVERVMSIARSAGIKEVSQWISVHLSEATPDHETLSKAAMQELSVELKSCERVLAFLVTKEISLVGEAIAVNCRKEGQLANLLLEALHMAAKEKSHLSIEERVELMATLRAIMQVRSGVISPEDGISFFRKIRSALPQSASYEASICMYQISYYYFQLNKLAMSRKSVLEALEYDETYAPALCFRAVLEIHEGHHNVAVALLEEAQASDNGYVFSHFYMGVLSEAKEDYNSAIAAYIRCLIVAPNFYEAALNLTNSLLDTGLILDAARWVSAFLSKYSAPATEFQTNIAVGLFQSGYSNHALKMLQSTYAREPSPLVALNIAKIYFGRAQAEMCKEWVNKVLSSDLAGVSEKTEARGMSKLVGKPDSIKAALAATPEPISRDEKIGDSLVLLLSQEFQVSEGTNNDIFQIVRRAINSKPRPAEKFAPKSVLAMRNSEARKAKDGKLAEQRRRYDEQIKQGSKEMESKHVGRKRRRHQNKNRFFTGDIALTRAPSYSAG